ncbi:RNA-binding S4 domain-containing protein [Haploplasma modicum]|jgi:ribosome-associated protein|uniref:RNA-binding S4 domain-containing protein n=1 Tax=Haploplasma modicum TaxID=2150 RepID=UPI00047ED403|nr:RNA-binding S4 domain-containing protein [Haploplasma modicum]MCR1809091.1 RNA-binding S4 domain-containing protein [Haploplasma modicum]
MKTFYLNGEFMTLAQFLKANDYINSGGEAKYFLQDYVVKINGEQCSLRGKKLYEKDIVTVGNDDFVLLYDKKD